MSEASNINPNGRRGRFVETPMAGEIVRAFMPPSLPPSPAIDILGLLPKLIAAERALGRLDGITVLLPKQELFLYMYVRKEAGAQNIKQAVDDLVQIDPAPIAAAFGGRNERRDKRPFIIDQITRITKRTAV